MAKVNKRKYFRPGTLEVPGTKITLKTQPYMNGVIFNPSDPISSFRSKMALLSLVLDGYSKMLEVQGLEQIIGKDAIVSNTQIAHLKLLINYFVESPIEIIIKEQFVTEDILAELEVETNNE